MRHVFEGSPLVVPADRAKRVKSTVNVDGLEGKLLGATAFLDSTHSDPTDLRVTLRAPTGAEDVLVSRARTVAGGYSVPQRLLENAPLDGAWTLQVDDLLAGDGGEVSWRLELETTSGGFFVELELSKSIRETLAYRWAFEQAATRIGELVTGALTPVTLPRGRIVENVLIFGDVVAIDGPGKILGQAGPTRMRDATLQPITGSMRFDDADMRWMADDGSLPQVIEHEMFHSALGVGTLWKVAGLIQGAGTSNPVFVGKNAMHEYALWSGKDGGVPVANTGGAGTREAHWREAVLDTELMTGFIDAGFNPISRITVASLEDCGGYEVDRNAADAFPNDLGAMLSARRGTVRRCCCSRFVPRRIPA